MDHSFPLAAAVCEYDVGKQEAAAREVGRLEIFCALSGAGVYGIGEEAVSFSAGDILVVNGLLGNGPVAHGVVEIHGEPRRAVEIAFHPQLLAGSGAMECDLWLLRLFHGGAAMRLEAAHARSAAAWEWVRVLAEGGEDQAGRARRKHALYGLLLELAAAFPERMRVRCDGEARRGRLRRLEPLFDYLGAHLQEHVGVAEAAGLVRMSESYFTRFFRATMGVKYSAYVEELRVNRAYELLLDGSGMSLAEIAAEAGFCDQCHLSRHFRRRFGASPGRLRARERALEGEARAQGNGASGPGR